MQRRSLNFNWFGSLVWLGLFASLLSLGCTQPQPQTPYAIAEAQYKNGRWDQAVETCSQILATAPDRAEVISLRARSLGAAGRYHDAIEDLTRWVELAPTDSEPLYHRAIAYQKVGEQELADADQQAAKSMDPLYKSAYAFEIDSAPARTTIPITPSRSEEVDDSTDAAVGADSADVNSMFGSTNSSANEAQESAAREEAIWERVEEHIQRETEKASDVATSRPSILDSDGDPSSKSSRDDKPDRGRALERVAEQLFVPDEAPEMTREDEAPPQPARPAISSALPTDFYGNPIRPGQALGANPNAPLGNPATSNFGTSPYPNAYGGAGNFGVPPNGGLNNYGTPGAYGGGQNFRPVPGQAYGGPNGLQTNPYQYPSAAPMPMQLQGKLGTNAGVPQYGGALYPAAVQPPATNGPYNPSAALNPNTAPSRLKHPPARAASTYRPGLPNNAPPPSSALPARYLQQRQLNKSATTPNYEPYVP